MRRKIGVSLIFAAVLPLAVASTAWACGILATLTLDHSVAAPGQVVNATGKNYHGVGDVSIRLMTRSGTPVASATPDPGSRIAATFPIPANTNPGWYVIMATQFKADGVTPAPGTPGRTSLRIQGASAGARAHHRRAAAVSPWGSPSPTPPTASAVPARDAGGLSGPAVVPMLLAVILSLALLATGSMLAGRRNQTPNRLPLSV